MSIRPLADIYEERARISVDDLLHPIMADDNGCGPNFWWTIAFGKKKHFKFCIDHCLPVLRYRFQSLVSRYRYPVILPAESYPLRIGYSFVSIIRIHLTNWVYLKSNRLP